MKKELSRSKVPVYVSVYNSLYSDITSGIYAEGELLPSEIALSEKYGVSRNTLRQALSVLSEDGLILRSQGRGTVVAKPATTLRYDKRANPMISLCRQPIDNIEIQYNFAPPTDIAKKVLELSKSDVILASDAIYQSQGVTVGHAFSQIPTTVLSSLDVDLSEEKSVEQLVVELIFTLAANWSVQIKLIHANQMEATFLQVVEGTPLILLETLIYDDPSAAPLARFKFFFRPECYNLKFWL